MKIGEDRGLEILERLLVRYLGGIDNPLAQGLLTRRSPEAAIRLEPQGSNSWNFTARGFYKRVKRLRSAFLPRRRAGIAQNGRIA